MTAEIAVLNSEAIALATDSAVTLTLPNEQKIFTTATKLFALSDSHPVGLMVFNSPSFIGVPWETIAKVYKNELPPEGYNTLREYSDSLFSLLQRSTHIFTEKMQREFLRMFLAGYYTSVIEQIEEEVGKIIDNEGSIDEKTVMYNVSRIISTALKFWRSFSVKKGCFPSLRKSKSIIAKYGEDVSKAIDYVFQKLPLSSKDRTLLHQLSAEILVKASNSAINSGVVIAGYGEKEVFPIIEVYTFDGMIDNALIYRFEDRVEVNVDSDGGVYAFAQKDMAARFMEGVDPEYQQMEQELVEQICSNYANAIIKKLKKYSRKEKKQLKLDFSQYGAKVYKEYLRSMSEFITEQFVDPITQVVSFLPKSELAMLAESLVSLTSLKRKFSVETETVAEPIDVALISKMDGFVWIRRKSYTKLV